MKFTSLSLLLLATGPVAPSFGVRMRTRSTKGKGKGKEECFKMSSGSKSSKTSKNQVSTCVGVEECCDLFEIYNADSCPVDPHTLEGLCGTSNDCISNAEAQCRCDEFEPADLCAAFRDAVTQVTFYERTGGPDSQLKGPYLANGSEMTERRSDPLSSVNRDFQGAGIEHYDVFWSDANGDFNKDGCYISVEALFNPQGGGGALNLAKVEVDFEDGPTEFATQVASAVFGELNGGNPGILGRAVDGNTMTHTVMGSGPNRLRVTVGFDFALFPQVNCKCRCLSYLGNCCSTNPLCTADAILGCVRI